VKQPKEINTFAGISSFILGTGCIELPDFFSPRVK
jgi:hypothetical protein